jgi:putative DNA primase/helicase
MPPNDAEDQTFETRVEKVKKIISEPWPEPRALPALAPEVPELPESLLPETLRPWLCDIADRIQIPLDFVAAPAIVGLASLVGRSVGIYPKCKDDWFVIPNLWGAIIARPGLLKTPAMAQALAPLKRLAAEASETFKDGAANTEASKDILDMKLAALKDQGRAAAKKSEDAKLASIQADMAELRGQLEEADSHERRYIVNDGTVEKIGELLNQNPRGLLMSRDELSGMLRTLDKPGREGDREFYLEAWNGDAGFTYDRIGRGTLHIPALTLSIFGTIQPGKLLAYISGAIQGERADDGLLQRFQVVVWPDCKGEWRNVDRWPDGAARDAAFDVFQRLDQLDAASLNTEANHDGIPALRFAPDAQELFVAWRADLEARLRTPEMEKTPAFESHLAKYRSLMPSLALIDHLTTFVSSVSAPAVGLESAKRAAAWCEFLEAHARKLYAAEMNAEVTASHALAEKIKAGAIADGDSIRDLYRSQWAGLRTPEAVCSGLKELERHSWLRIEERDTGGRRAEIIVLNPELRRRAA